MADEQLMTQQQDEVNQSEQTRIRIGKLNKLMEEGRNPYEITKFDQTHHSDEIIANYDALEDQTVTIAGRMIARRIMGKASFATILDRNGQIQIYVRRDDVGEEIYADFKTWDLADIVGVTGKVFKTRTGEISVHAEQITLLTKSLHPLPEKFHGLQDTDTRYRQRYLDLIVNPDVKDTFIKRSKIISTIRKYLDVRASSRSRRPCWSPMPAALRPVPSKRTSTPSTRMSSCAFPWNSTSSA